MKTPYKRSFSFSGFQANQPAKSLPGPRVDIELDAIADRLARAGASAYDLAVVNGFVGTEAEYLASLIGPAGPAVDPASLATLLPGVLLTPTGGIQRTLPDAIGDRYDKTTGNTTPRTGLFWTSFDSTAVGLPPSGPGRVGAAKIQRINDRVQIGLACILSGDFPASTKDPLEAFEAQRSSSLGFRSSWSQLCVGSEVGGIGVTGYAFTSSVQDPNWAGFQLCIGGHFASINDNVAIPQLATALYTAAFQLPGAASMVGTGTVAAEFDIINEGATAASTPGNIFPAGFTCALQLCSGALSPFAKVASHAMAIGNNGQRFRSGIIVAQNSIDGLTYDPSGNGRAIGGEGTAIALGNFQTISWCANDASAPVAQILSETLTPANRQAIRFQDTGMVFGGAAFQGRSLQLLYTGVTTGPWVQIAPAVGANPCTITAGGATNANIAITAAGSGRLVLDRATSIRATSGPSAGFLEIEVMGSSDPLCIELKKRA